MKCKHWECPYKDCDYHQETTGKYNDYFERDNMPYYLPKNDDDAEDCIAYMDL